MNFYNENDPKAAAWLRELIAEGLIPAGVVDERSISDVHPNDLSGFTQCHFFAGIGGWSLALALAGWPAERAVWTGSCPCQPFSTAGKQMGRKDPRHLWPAFRRLINRCRPPVVFGEQVASKDGREWLARVFANLETMGYAPAGLDLCAAGIRAPHIRQRLWWVGERLADSSCDRRGEQRLDPRGSGERSGEEGLEQRSRSGGILPCGLVNTSGSRSQGHDRHGNDGNQSGRIDAIETGSTGSAGRLAGGVGDSNGHGCESRGISAETTGHGCPAQPDDFWADSRPILCRDGKHRRIPAEPALFPLADGIPYKLARRGTARTALLRGAGNAIVPQVAAEFIRAYLTSDPSAPV